MQDDLISVIVPVYKTEAFLDQCIASIVAQTHSNLEIILVEDVSPDRCGAMCDAWAEKDARIKVLHRTVNGSGPSGARNAGLDIARGDFIGFADSDDWIEPAMFERLLTVLRSTTADLSICGIVHEWPRKKIVRSFEKDAWHDRDTALKMLVEDCKMQNYAWDKLYRRGCFDGMRFPEGKTFEDILLMWRIFERCSRIAVTQDVLYHYRRHRDSIVGTFGYPQRKAFCLNHQDRYACLAGSHPELLSVLAAKYFSAINKLCDGYAALALEEAETEAPFISEQIRPFWEQHRREMPDGPDAGELCAKIDYFVRFPMSHAAKSKIAGCGTEQAAALQAMQARAEWLSHALDGIKQENAALDRKLASLKKQRNRERNKAEKFAARMQAVQKKLSAARQKFK